MFRDPKFCECVKDFRTLGSGRKKKEVLVGDSPSLHDCMFSFRTKIAHNWPGRQSRRIVFTNKKVFDMRTRTIEGKESYIFFCSTYGKDLFLKQQEIKNIEALLDAADLETVKIVDMVVADEALQQAFEKRYGHVGKSVNLLIVIRTLIKENLTLLALKQLRTVANLLESRKRAETALKIGPAA